MKQITAFECGHCRKIYRSERGVNKHEVRCTRNPENQRPCFSCRHLHKEKVNGYAYGEERTFEAFHCRAKDIFLYPPITGHKGNFWDIEEAQEPMPKTCGDFSDSIKWNERGLW